MFVIMRYKLRWGVLSHPRFYGPFSVESLAEQYAKHHFTEEGDLWIAYPITAVEDKEEK